MAFTGGKPHMNRQDLNNMAELVNDNDGKAVDEMKLQRALDQVLGLQKDMGIGSSKGITLNFFQVFLQKVGSPLIGRVLHLMNKME